MVLRSGVILPFQFRDTKKLLMIGEPYDNRPLSIWDFRKIVRAVFGINNFKFRNKKIGFNIPDELLLQYLAQRHDLTNFVIEIIQDDANAGGGKSIADYDNSDTMKSPIIALPQRSNESANNDSLALGNVYNHHENNSNGMNAMQGSRSPLEVVDDHSSQSSSLEPAHQRIRVLQEYNVNPTESLNGSRDRMNLVPKSEKDDSGLRERSKRDLTCERPPTALGHQLHQPQTQQHHSQSSQQQQHQQQQEQQQQQQQHSLQQLQHAAQQSQIHQQQQHFLATYGHHNAMAINQANITAVSHANSPLTAAQTSLSTAQALSHILTQPPQSQYSATVMNRFRRRGERMSKDQKELYVKFFEENPCMLLQRRNDAVLEPLWIKLSNLLNSVPQGAVKNVEEWKQTFDAWRYRVFMYTRYNSKLANTSIPNPKSFKPLTATDQRAYAMWTSHKNTIPQDYEKIDIFPHLEETQSEYAY